MARQRCAGSSHTRSARPFGPTIVATGAESGREHGHRLRSSRRSADRPPSAPRCAGRPCGCRRRVMAGDVGPISEAGGASGRRARPGRIGRLCRGPHSGDGRQVNATSGPTMHCDITASGVQVSHSSRQVSMQRIHIESACLALISGRMESLYGIEAAKTRPMCSRTGLKPAHSSGLVPFSTNQHKTSVYMPKHISLDMCLAIPRRRPVPISLYLRETGRREQVEISDLLAFDLSDGQQFRSAWSLDTAELDHAMSGSTNPTCLANRNGLLDGGHHIRLPAPD